MTESANCTRPKQDLRNWKILNSLESYDGLALFTLLFQNSKSTLRIALSQILLK